MRIPGSHNDGILRLFEDGRHMDEEAHATGVLLVLEGKVDEVRTRGDEFHPFEHRPGRPVLVIDSKLHSFRRVQ